RGGASAWARGAMAAGALWACLCLGGWRAIWYLWPSQPSDWAIIGFTTLAASALGFLARSVGARRGRWGLLAAFVCVEFGACVVQMRFPARELGTLLMLPPFLLVPVSAVVALWERLSRPPESDPLESAAFASALLGAFLALLVPGV
ncbi:MAG: hypothetical protein MUF34_31955, partial [Polyangiaceae bacterium]|nr:hypothetical protein [Polyangiaceae bacterium]